MNDNRHQDTLLRVGHLLPELKNRYLLLREALERLAREDADEQDLIDVDLATNDVLAVLQAMMPEPQEGDEA